MERKKNKPVDLERRRLFHLTVGLVLAVSVVFVAFEWKYAEGTVIHFDVVEHDFPEVPLMEVTEIKPPKPKVVLPKIVAVPDEVDPEVELEIIFDVPVDEPVEEPIEEPEPEETPDVHLIVEEQPSFPGGVTAFYRYIGKHLKYPPAAIRQEVEGRVFVQFVVNQDGSLTDLKVVKGIGAGCDAEAIRVLKTVPNWNPGKQRGVPVRVQMMIPITFQLR